MQCDFLDWRGSILGGWYCQKKKDYIDKATVNLYCDNSLAFRSCPTFKKVDSGTGCYLTTVMCEALNKEDDCEELETLRGFRDNYMKKDSQYDGLLKDYDKIGPMVSEKIRTDRNRLQIAIIMKFAYIDRAIELINKEQYDDAIKVYMRMTLDLLDNYGIDKSILDSDYYDLLDKGKARKREK